MKIHIKILHEGQTNYKYDSCIEFFTGKGDLKKHINAVHHEGQRIYVKCDACGKSFGKSNYLEIHIKHGHEGTIVVSIEINSTY